MTELTIQKYQDRAYGFLKITATLTSDEIDPKVFVVKNMDDPADLPNQVPYLMDVASRVDMTAYTDTPDVDGIYRIDTISVLEHDEYTLDLIIAQLSEDVEENVTKIQRQPLDSSVVEIINSDS